MDEFQFIDSIKQNTYRQSSLIKGIGDDAAVIRSSNKDVVTAVDTFVENIHFSKETMSYFQVGYRALAANISDLAAMGATPAYYLVSIVVPNSINDDALQDIYHGMDKIAKAYNVDLIGGDTVSGEQLTISITIIGYVMKGKARYRHQAKHDDIVFVTGTLGSARAGLHILLHSLNIEGKDFFIRKHQMPTPRVHFATSLQPINRLSLNDISDGIANELYEIATASNVTITIQDDQIPVHEKLYQFTDEQRFHWKYFGGEDFELVGTVSKTDWPVIKEVAEKQQVLVTKIGRVIYNEETNGKVFINKDGKISRLEKRGYIHMK